MENDHGFRPLVSEIELGRGEAGTGANESVLGFRIVEPGIVMGPRAMASLCLGHWLGGLWGTGFQRGVQHLTEGMFCLAIGGGYCGIGGGFWTADRCTEIEVLSALA